ncbi:PadR family transcriptional regulator [Hamadaea tsunoensis]|uniref:PadR family transcriptional regulator n=1 Tax=Hamadaea tsunoensis TaxID=53368 RepID=UPI00040DB2AA|nr:PadR family transcriptional regulator [Hamadaea tsunoensis]
MTTTFRRSPLALAILGLLEDGPLHPYAMQQLIKKWGKDQVVNVEQRATLYKMITRLAEAGLIRAHATSKDQQYPERTSYEVTDAGRAAARQWMGEILAVPRNEYPEFPAALSFLPMLSPESTLEHLERRRAALRERLAVREEMIGRLDGFDVPRVSLLETEYLRAVVAAELRWLDEVIAGLTDGSIAWSREQFAAVAAQWT